MIRRLINWVMGRKHQCGKCGSWDTKRSLFWTRGWNNLCNQAYGDWGTYCYDCRHVTFDTSLEEHLKTLPNWCTPYERKEQTP